MIMTGAFSDREVHSLHLASEFFFGKHRLGEINVCICILELEVLVHYDLVDLEKIMP